MDYVTRQFINLAKKLRDDLRRTLQNHTNAISDATRAAYENKQDPLPVPLPVIAELQIPEADKREQRTQHQESRSLQIWLVIGTWLGVLAASIYAGIAYRQWKTAHQALIENRDTTTKQLAKLDSYITEAQNANKIAIAANRPWMGHVPIDILDPHHVKFFETLRDPDGQIFVNARYIWSFKNAGKRPAQVERIRATGKWYKNCPETPDYNFLPPGSTRAHAPYGGRSLVLPDATILSALQTQIPMDEWQLIQESKLQFCIYSIIEYRDVDYPMTIHHTTDCRAAFVLPPPPEGQFTYVECVNNYAGAD